MALKLQWRLNSVSRYINRWSTAGKIDWKARLEGQPGVAKYNYLRVLAIL